MPTSLFLIEGGVGGHMSHLYDNPKLTFAQLRAIFQAAAQGELVGTEKTDGQNLFISYSVKDGKAKAARNKSNIKQGGLTAQELAAKFAGRGSVEAAFNDAFEIFEVAVSSLPIRKQIDIFGEDANIFYNAEIQDPRNANVINYNTKTLNIHRVGHAAFNRETGEVLDVDVSRNATALEQALTGMQSAVADRDFRIQVNAIRNLEALTDKKPLEVAMQSLESAMDDAGIADNETIGDYIIARLVPMIRAYLNIPQENEKLLLKRIMGVKTAVEDPRTGKTIRKGISLAQIKQNLNPQQKQLVGQLVSDSGKLMQTAIQPIEDAVHDFSVEMLKGLKSAFVLDQEAEVKRLRAEVDQAIKAIEKSNNEDAIEVLTKQMSKLKSIENISTAAEGFVFDYDGYTYKFTGNFAPVNQLLGMFKYGRGKIPAMKGLVGETSLEDEKTGRVIALVPGKYKPPHRGHLEMIKHYSRIADMVKVLVSPLSREYDEKKEITAEDSIDIWQIYIKDAGLANVEVMRAPKNSPVGTAFDFVANDTNKPEWAQPGDEIVLGTSTKGGDQSRFAGNVQKYAREGVTVLDPMEYAFDASAEDALSATDFRNALAAGDDIFKWLPDSSHHNEEAIKNILAEPEKKTLTMEGLFSLVEELIDEVYSEKQRKWACAQMGDSRKKFKGEPSLSAKEAEEMCKSKVEEEEEIDEASSMAAGNVQGYSGRGKREPEGLIREED